MPEIITHKKLTNSKKSKELCFIDKVLKTMKLAITKAEFNNAKSNKNIDEERYFE